MGRVLLVYACQRVNAMSDRSHVPVLGMACLILALLLGVMYWIATPARSQQTSPCGPTKEVEKNIEKEFGESPAVAAISQQRQPILIFVNPKTGTFTITIRRPGNISCVTGAGENWTPLEIPIQGQDL